MIILYAAFLRASPMVMKSLNHHKTVCSLKENQNQDCSEITAANLFWQIILDRELCIFWNKFSIIADFVWKIQLGAWLQQYADTDLLKLIIINKEMCHVCYVEQPHIAS